MPSMSKIMPFFVLMSVTVLQVLFEILYEDLRDPALLVRVRVFRVYGEEKVLLIGRRIVDLAVVADVSLGIGVEAA